MSQLIKLNVSKRTPSPGNSLVINPTLLYGFDIEDIIVPIRRNAGNTASYFTALMLKGSAVGASENNGRADYEVSDALVGIAGQTASLVLLTVLSRREKDMSSEQMIFVKSRISENITPLFNPGTGSYDISKFYYNEGGDPLPVEYIVAEDIDAIVTSGPVVAPLPSTVTEINYDLVNTDFVDLNELYSGELIINLTTTGASSTLANILNYTNVTKITIRPTSALNPLSVTDGVVINLTVPTLSVFGPTEGFLELSKRNNNWYQTNYIDQYN